MWLRHTGAFLVKNHAALSRSSQNLLPATYNALDGKTSSLNLMTGSDGPCHWKLQNDLNTTHLRMNYFHTSRETKTKALSWMDYTSPKVLTEEAPKSLQPYLKLMRFDKPIGSWLFYIPCTWSISLAAAPGHIPDLWMLTLFAVGSIPMRGAGCVVNDMWDKDFDSKVARTVDRPLASGQVTYKQAAMFLGLQSAISLGVFLCMNNYTIILGLCSFGLVVTYPLMKRFTHWPQAYLGLTFNWGAMLGYSAVQGSCYWPVVLPLYISSIAWTLFYDTIYAHQDKEDDKLIGVKSTALLFGDKTKAWLAGFSGVMIPGLLASGYMADQTWPYYASVAAVAGHLLWQMGTVDLNNREDCGNKFRSNKNLGLILLAGIIAGNLMKPKEEDKEKEIEESI